MWAYARDIRFADPGLLLSQHWTLGWNMKEGFWLWNIYSCPVIEGQRLLVILECPSQASPRLWLLCPIVSNESWGDGGLATVNSCRYVWCEVCVGLELWLLMLFVCTNAYLRVSFVLLIFGPHPEVLSTSFLLCDYGSTTAGDLGIICGARVDIMQPHLKSHFILEAM